MHPATTTSVYGPIPIIGAGKMISETRLLYLYSTPSQLSYCFTDRILFRPRPNRRNARTSMFPATIVLRPRKYFRLYNVQQQLPKTKNI